MQKIPKIRSRKHLQFISQLPCVITRHTEVQAAHIRSGNGAGMGLKSGDDCVVPLYWREHLLQHECGELMYWSQYGGIGKATELAKALYANTGNNEAALRLIGEFR